MTQTTTRRRPPPTRRVVEPPSAVSPEFPLFENTILVLLLWAPVLANFLLLLATVSTTPDVPAPLFGGHPPLVFVVAVTFLLLAVAILVAAATAKLELTGEKTEAWVMVLIIELGISQVDGGAQYIFLSLFVVIPAVILGWRIFLARLPGMPNRTPPAPQAAPAADGASALEAGHGQSTTMQASPTPVPILQTVEAVAPLPAVDVGSAVAMSVSEEGRERAATPKQAIPGHFPVQEGPAEPSSVSHPESSDDRNGEELETQPLLEGRVLSN
ncbi:hypothetical protein C8J57DRAFT_1244595 [Mycena rebaudengoi]|nr:hypothetical protein C8J57DRAFT_1244595 [Mycena rebaudengoi]